jgi:hypothetical protein
VVRRLRLPVAHESDPHAYREGAYCLFSRFQRCV